MQTDYMKRAIDYKELINCLLDDHSYADIVLTNGKVINVITREVYPADIAIKNEYIVMIGNCNDLIGTNTKVVDVDGAFLSPGFIDSHMHFESSMLTITEFSRLSIPSGTTTLVADPHEIGNALGADGMKAMADEVNHVPNKVHLVVPALVPDCPTLETSGGKITQNEIEDLLNYKNICGIGELQGFSNVKNVFKYTPDLINDLLASSFYAVSKNLTVDGNASNLFGKELASHIISTGGNCSCHETTTKEECIEKLRQGVYVFIREGSTQKNMSECIKAVTEEGLDSRRCILATDDMLAVDLENLGHMNEVVRRTIKEGVNPVEAIQMVTINPAAYFRFKDIGVLAPGKKADIAIISDIEEMNIKGVFIDGKLIALDGKLLVPLSPYKYPDYLRHSIKIDKISEDRLEIKADSGQAKVRCMVVIPDQNLTGKSEELLNTSNSIVLPDLTKDILPICCIERYGKTHGNIGKCFVKGFGIKTGAFAESIGHDTHNIMVVGTNYKDMMIAVNDVIEMEGGLSIAQNGKVIEHLKLPFGGLITDELTGIEVSRKIASMEQITRDILHCGINAPFMHLSFLSLSTSPEWKLTDKGLVDVETYQILDPII